MYSVEDISTAKPEFAFIRHDYSADIIERINNQDFFSLVIDLIKTRRPIKLSDLLRENPWQDIFGLTKEEMLTFMDFLKAKPNQEVVFLKAPVLNHTVTALKGEFRKKNLKGPKPSAIVRPNPEGSLLNICSSSFNQAPRNI